MKKAVIYLRTSSNTNVGEDKDSDKRQRLACQRYAKTNKVKIIAEFYDAAIKGRDAIGSRPGFSDLLEYCQQADVQTIIFENAGRLARDQIVQELGYRELRDAGYTLICADAPDHFTDDTDNPSLKMIRQILGVVAEFQKDELVLKLKGARERKKTINKGVGIVTLNGKGKCGGRPSYKETNEELITTAKSLKRKKDPKTGKRLSLWKVSASLAEQGFVTAKGQAYSASQVKRLLG